MRIALVHDYLNQLGGAERVVAALHEIYPGAPLYTSIFEEGKMPGSFQRMDVRTSFMQKIPFISSVFRWYFWLYPLAFESFDLSEYEVIFSSSSAYAKGVKKSKDQLHVCYCHTPARFLFRFDDYVKREEFPDWIKLLLPFLLDPVKKWDRQNSAAVDYFIANSQAVARRIRELYGRESVIIPPPVDGSFFEPSGIDQDYYLIVSRLAHYKRIDIAIEAFNELDLPLKIIGEGPARAKLERIAGPNVQFLGRLPGREVARYMAESRALVFPGEEDFGIAPLEAMACGRPVIAYRAGGALETVVENETGIFFSPQTPQALTEAVRRFIFEIFDKKKIRAHALQFDKPAFKQKIAEFVKGKYEEKFK